MKSSSTVLRQAIWYSKATGKDDYSQVALQVDGLEIRTARRAINAGVLQVMSYQSKESSCLILRLGYRIYANVYHFYRKKKQESVTWFARTV